MIFFSPFFILLTKESIQEQPRGPWPGMVDNSGTHWYELPCSPSKRIYMHCNETLNAPHHELPAGEQLILKTFPLVPADHYLVKFIYIKQQVNTETSYATVSWNTGKQPK